MPYSQLVIVLSEHPVLGILLMPYVAEIISKEELYLTEQAFHLSPQAMAQLNEVEQKAIQIASHYTEKYLMSVYSKEKTTSKFLHNLSDEPEKQKTIRRFIEKKLIEMMELIRTSDLPLYQKQTGSKRLYPHHACRVHKEETQVSFAFEADEQSFSYRLTCRNEGEVVPLRELKPATVLTSNPATLLLGMEVYFFQHIEAARILPFTKKEVIRVDASLTEKYIDKILIPTACHHEVSVQGIEVRREETPCDCLLYIEETIYSTPLLRLSFRYGDRSFAPQTTTKALTYFSREKDGEKNVLRYFRRHTETEEKAVRMLQEAGLRRINEAHFRLSRQAPEKNMTEWITTHRAMLQASFILTSDLQKAPLCLDEIRFEQHYDEGPDWFDLHITVVIGEMRIPFSRFRKHILEERREYTLPDGRVILLPEEWFCKYANLMELGTAGEKSIRVKRPLLGIVESIMKDDTRQKISQSGVQKQYLVPTEIKAQLRPYQQKGYNWMMHLYEQGFGGCLADDMGLGKTLQTLTLLQNIYSRHEENPDKTEPTDAPYIPAGIDETGQFDLFGDLTAENTLNPADNTTGQAAQTPRKPSTLIVVPTSLLHNWKREAARFTALSTAEYNSSSHFRKGHPEWFFDRFHLIFVSYGTMRNKIDVLRQYCFEYVVLDESQNIKNSDSLAFRSAIQLRAHHRLILTGTPIENSLKDLWAQFRFLQPDLLGNESAFAKQFIQPIKQGNNRMEMRLQQLIAPFILRRGKREVAPELPPLTEEIIYCDMTEQQAEQYLQEKNSLRNTLLQLRPTTPREHRPFTVLNGISRLRQLACHPRMVHPGYEEGSGKLELIIDTYRTLRSEGHKVLIFSSFVKHLELIAAEFHRQGWPYALLTGSTANRQEEIARFSESEEIQAFLISLKAGGVGLNLTQADYVFIVDPWWNPAAEAQAIARAHRIGQDKQVIAYRFITKESIEEKIIRLQESKRWLAETFIPDSESMPTLTDQEWIDLLA